VLGNEALRIEHVGSTSVPGLMAKPIVDILLIVLNSADEPCYVPQLQAAGYVMRIREPEWFEHRLFRAPDTTINLHVFSSGAAEVERTLRFPAPAARRPHRAGPLPARQTPPRPADLAACAGLRRCQDRRHRRDPRRRGRRTHLGPVADGSNTPAAALRNAIARRTPVGTVVHSDSE
jgi:hypothetical protein